MNGFGISKLMSAPFGVGCVRAAIVSRKRAGTILRSLLAAAAIKSKTPEGTHA